MLLKRFLPALLALAALALLIFGLDGTVSAKAQDIPAPSDPMTLYGQEILFDVQRDGDDVGWHSVRFDRDGSRLTVESAFYLQIDMLFLTVFRYDYKSTATWYDGELERLTVRVDDDGEAFDLVAKRDDGRLIVATADEVLSLDVPVYPTNHWNAGVLGEDRVLNTLTGRLNRVEIEALGREAVETERGPIEATRYAYSGDLETEVWYDDADRWVKMRFKGRDGSSIEYLCRRCQGGIGEEARW